MTRKAETNTNCSCTEPNRVCLGMSLLVQVFLTSCTLEPWCLKSSLHFNSAPTISSLSDATAKSLSTTHRRLSCPTDTTVARTIFNAMFHNSVNVFRNSRIQCIQSRICFKLHGFQAQSNVLHHLHHPRLTLYDLNVTSKTSESLLEPRRSQPEQHRSSQQAPGQEESKECLLKWCRTEPDATAILDAARSLIFS
ncbi:hypothetical protein EV424DRAFT_665986 [Suillus variegatus]|nr:hypothetical protein EV424DRAFT_665986 [Suillus variegatus]